MMYNYSPFQTRSVDLFNRNGHIREHIDFDTINGFYFRRNVFRYDSSGRLMSAVCFLYYRFDVLEKKFKKIVFPDTTYLQFELDSLERVIKQVELDTAGKKMRETIYSFDPVMIRDKHFRHDSCISEITIACDIPFIANKETIAVYQPDGSNKTSTWLYKNTFDKAGRIKSRRAEKTGENGDEDLSEESPVYFRHYTYQYTHQRAFDEQDTF